ncbi:MAG TPA: serine hydrolase domain-containing protein [Candidatus Limnocylindria bacterium]|nr:serine hydrolase domain-containing protein [Candidatus Limnocylindria bacterium]
MKSRRAAAVLALLLVFVLLPAGGETSPGAALPPGRAVTPDEAARIDAYVQEQMREGRIPGLALAVVRDGQAAYLKGYGVAEGARPVTPQTPFYIGSVGKTITALAIRRLAGEGKVRYDAPVTDYIPWFTLADPDAAARITISHLVRHTSGLSNADGVAPYTYSAAYSIEDVVRRLARVAPARRPGVLEEYSNLNYIILGLVVEKASGMAYGDYVQKYIFDRLGMAHSHTSPEAAQRDGLAPGHMLLYGIPVTTRLPLPRAQVPAGFQMSSAEDMARFASLYLTNGYLDGESVFEGNELAEAGAQAAGGAHYGTYFMPERGQPAGLLGYSGHLGASSDYTSALLVNQSRRTAVVVLANANNGFQDPAISSQTIANGVCTILDTGAQPRILRPDASQAARGLIFPALTLAFLAFRALGVRGFQKRLRRGRLRGALAMAGFALDGVLALVLLYAAPLVFDVSWGYLLNSNPAMWLPVLVAGVSLAVVAVLKAALLIRGRAAAKRLAAAAA